MSLKENPPNPPSEQRLHVENGQLLKIPVYSAALSNYVFENSFTPHPILKKIQSEAADDKMHFMMTSPDQAALLHLLTKISGAKSILEIGCYFGYSTIAMASALPEGGKIISLDHNPQWSSKAKEYFLESGLSSKIDLRIGEALDLIPKLKDEMALQAKLFDFIFIDADKKNSFNYYLACIDLLRSGGMMLIDNVLWRGHILDENDNSERVVALRKLNDYVTVDPKVESLVLTVSDGMLLIRKK